MKRKLERETVVNFLTLLLHCLEVGWQNVVSWCSGRALSPNDVIQQIENTLTCYKSASHKLKSERSELQCTRSRSDRASDEVWRSTCFVCMDLNHIINSREKKKDWQCCVGSGVKYHWLFYWSIVMTSPVEFSTGEFRVKQVWKVL